MAVENRNGPLYMTATLGDPVADGRADFRVAGARVYVSTEVFVIEVGDDPDSTYTVGRIPKDAVLVAPSKVRTVTVVTGNISLGNVDFPEALLDGVAGAANTTYEFWPGHNTGEVGFDMVGRPMWEVMGYASSADAPEHIDLIITLEDTAQATADGTGIVQTN
jgi:hypothetical protein